MSFVFKSSLPLAFNLGETNHKRMCQMKTKIQFSQTLKAMQDYNKKIIQTYIPLSKYQIPSMLMSCSHFCLFFSFYYRSLTNG